MPENDKFHYSVEANTLIYSQIVNKLDVSMLSRVFWIFAGVLFALSLVLFTAVAGGVTDYRAWVLLALGIIVASLGNISRSTGHGH
jgi:hypothetical protein